MPRRLSAYSRSDPGIVEHEPIRVVRQIGLEAVICKGLEPYDAPVTISVNEGVPLRGSMHREIDAQGFTYPG